MKEFTRPKAHCDIDTPGRDPELKKAPCPRLYTLASCPYVYFLDFLAFAFKVFCTLALKGFAFRLVPPFFLTGFRFFLTATFFPLHGRIFHKFAAWHKMEAFWSFLSSIGFSHTLIYP